MLLNRNVFTSDKRAQSGPVRTQATLLSPRGSAIPSGAVGFMLGTQGPLGDPVQALWLVPKDKGQRPQPKLNSGALSRGLQHISGTFLEPQHSCGMGTPK